jgi:transcription elongation factor S-II
LNSKFKELKAYADKARSLVFNFTDPKNPRFKQKVLKGDVTPWDVVTLSAKELASDEVKVEREKTISDSMAERRTDWQLEQNQKT